MSKPLALVVEDDSDVAELYTHLLNLLGFETEIVVSGDKAYERLQEVVPNFMILDLRLEGKLNGPELLDRIHGDTRLVDMLLIVISGYPWLAEGIGDKADMVLLKPIDVRQLATLIQRLRIGKPNLLPAGLDPLENRLLDAESFAERIGYNLDRLKKYPDYRFATIGIRLERIEPEGPLPRELEDRLKFETARRIRRRLRLVDLATLIKDRDYMVLLYQIHEYENAGLVARRLVHVLRQPFIFEEDRYVHTAAAGVVLSNPGITSAEEMISLARSALETAVRTEKEIVFHHQQAATAGDD